MNFRIFIVVSLIIIAFSACDRKKEKRDLLTDRIEYDVQIDNEDSMEPFMNNVAPSDRMTLLEFMFDQLAGGLAVDSMGVKIDEAAVKNLLMQFDSTLRFGEAKLFEYVRNDQIKVQVLRFREKWTYNPENFCIYKQVQAIAPGIIIRDSANIVQKIVPLFWVNCDTLEMENPVLLTELIISDALVQNNTSEVKKLYGESSPYYLNNIDEAKRDKYFLDLKDNVASHKIKSYDYFFKELSVSMAEDFNDHMDTVYIPDSLGNPIPYAYEARIMPKEFTRLKFVEKWEFSTSPFVFHKQVMGVNPSVYVIDEFDEFQGYRPLFWVVFNEEDLQQIKSVTRF